MKMSDFSENKLFCQKNPLGASKKSTTCVEKFHSECWTIPLGKIRYIEVVVLRHTSYRRERFDNPINSVQYVHQYPHATPFPFLLSN
jgi:hypothetical protein